VLAVKPQRWLLSVSLADVEHKGILLMIRPDSTGLGEEAECRQGSCGSTCFKKDRHATGR